MMKMLSRKIKDFLKRTNVESCNSENNITFEELVRIKEAIDLANASRYQAVHKTKFLSEEECMKEIENHSAYAIIKAKNQTEAMCIKAVKKDARALEYVDNPTDMVYLSALESDEVSHHYISKDIMKALAVKGMVKHKSLYRTNCERIDAFKHKNRWYINITPAEIVDLDYFKCFVHDERRGLGQSLNKQIYLDFLNTLV